MKPLLFAAAVFLTACGGDGEPPCADLQQMQAAVNEARSQGRYCGAQLYGSAPPLRLSFGLTEVAKSHSKGMATLGYVSHQDDKGQKAADRVLAVGYPFPVGENVAGGTLSLEETMQRFLESEGHCQNIMNPRAVEFGGACEEGMPPYRLYWTFLFGVR